MEEVKNETKQTKAQVYNVIILDKSGSMESIRQAAISGFNETLNGIKKAQEKFADTQEHYVSLVAFCSCETKQIFDKVPVEDARHLTMEDYQPCCCTPLYDAMGFTLTTMRKHVKSIEDAVMVVTIITDGMENDSKEYTGAAVKQLVEQLKGEGWTFTYMGANQDSSEMGAMAKDTSTRMNFFGRLHAFASSPEAKSCSKEEKNEILGFMADEAFDEEENKR